MRNIATTIIILLVTLTLLSSVALAAQTPTPTPATGMTYKKMLGILDNIVGFILRMAGFASMGVIIYFGVRMLLAGGDPTVYAAARKGFNWALVGTLVIFGVYTIIATTKGAVESLSR